MAIKVNGTTVINDSRALSNIASVDATTATTIGNAVGGGANFINSTSVGTGNNFTVTGFSGANQIKIMMVGVSNFGQAMLLKLGTSGGLATSGYKSSTLSLGSGGYGNLYDSTAHIPFHPESNDPHSSVFTLSRMANTNTWLSTFIGRGGATGQRCCYGAGRITLGGSLTQFNINGTSNFSAGTYSVEWS